MKTCLNTSNHNLPFNCSCFELWLTDSKDSFLSFITYICLQTTLMSKAKQCCYQCDILQCSAVIRHHGQTLHRDQPADHTKGKRLQCLDPVDSITLLLWFVVISNAWSLCVVYNLIFLRCLQAADVNRKISIWNDHQHSETKLKHTHTHTKSENWTLIKNILKDRL